MFTHQPTTLTEKEIIMSDFSEPEFEADPNKPIAEHKQVDDPQSSTQAIDNTPKDEFTEQLLVYLALCKLGDRTAFEQLYQLTAAKLNGIAYRITRNIDTANEVLQEAFIQIWQHREKYQAHKSEPFTWLAAIVRYRAYDHLRYDKRRQQNNTVEFNETDIDDFYNAFGEFDPINASKEALNTCLAKLEQKQSKAILMAYLYGYSREDIADYFSSPISTVKSWIRRGLGRLQLCLSN